MGDLFAGFGFGYFVLPFLVSYVLVLSVSASSSIIVNIQLHTLLLFISKEECDHFKFSYFIFYALGR